MFHRTLTCIHFFNFLSVSLGLRVEMMAGNPVWVTGARTECSGRSSLVVMANSASFSWAFVSWLSLQRPLWPGQSATWHSLLYLTYVKFMWVSTFADRTGNVHSNGWGDISRRIGCELPAPPCNNFGIVWCLVWVDLVLQMASRPI